MNRFLFACAKLFSWFSIYSENIQRLLIYVKFYASSIQLAGIVGIGWKFVAAAKNIINVAIVQ